MLHKIVIVATIAVTVIAQPYYQTPVAGSVPVDLDECSAESTCTNSDAGYNFFCYTVDYTRGATATGSGGSEEDRARLCFPSGLASLFTNSPRVNLQIPTTADDTEYDLYTFVRYKPQSANTANMLTDCSTNADCAAANAAGPEALPDHCCASFVFASTYMEMNTQVNVVKKCVRDWASAPDSVAAPIIG